MPRRFRGGFVYHVLRAAIEGHSTFQVSLGCLVRTTGIQKLKGGVATNVQRLDLRQIPTAVSKPVGFSLLPVSTTFNADGQTMANINALGFRNTNIYDAGGRGVASVAANGGRSMTVFDSVGSIDPLGNRITSVYNTAGRVFAGTRSDEGRT